MRNAAELAFLKTVELGSIRAAARALGQDPSGISRRVTQLETRFGTKLVDRSGNATRPTQQGKLYFDRLKEIIAQLEALEAEISGEALHPSGLLRVTAAIDFGQEFLAPWLLEFRGLYPDVEFDLMLSSGFLDLTQNNIDVAVRAGRLPDSSLIARKLAEVPRVLVASPAYLDRRGRPETPQELSDHDYVFFVPGNRTTPMELIGPDGARHRIPRSKGVAINAVRAGVAAVRAGHGIHNGPLWAFTDLIASGEVVDILPDYRQEAFPLYAVRRPSIVVPARITAFTDFLRQKVREVPGLTRAD
ncbi:LysR family transcriptional regulator [Tropicimonas sp. S265A]|uniref:LysR family transcriptional regulator n=1 Tax=Tropicimonas sp. S265A TaxID=3415134 RepID=UPI003C7ABCEC